MSLNFLSACLLMGIGHIGFWLAHNSQFTWDWWANRPILSNAMFGFPGSIIFWYGVKIMMVDVQSLWSIRFMGFATSYFVFPIMTWVLLGETPFTLKTTICFLLSISIILVQILVK